MSAEHDKAAELLPWYVNGTLAADERAAVERHLGECLPCRSALRAERHLHGVVRAQEDVPFGSVHGTADLLRRIDDGQRRHTARRLGPRIAVGAAAACLAIAAWVFLPGQLGPEDAGFATLGDPATNGGRIDIVFIDGTARRQIEAVLETVDAELVGGPSELGRYTVSVPADSERALADVIAELAEHPRVRFVGRNFIDAPAGEPAER